MIGAVTHSSTKYKAECRKILQISKDSFYGEEDEFDLTWKTYDELIECYKTQNSLQENAWEVAIQNTNVFAEMVENFELDRSFKYPTLYGGNVRKKWKQLIYSEFISKLKLGIINSKKRVIQSKNCRRIQGNVSAWHGKFYGVYVRIAHAVYRKRHSIWHRKGQCLWQCNSLLD